MEFSLSLAVFFLYRHISADYLGWGLKWTPWSSCGFYFTHEKFTLFHAAFWA